MEKKYDLTWIVENLDSEWVKAESESFIELVQWMKSELDFKDIIIKAQDKTIEKYKEMIELQEKHISFLQEALETINI